MSERSGRFPTHPVPRHVVQMADCSVENGVIYHRGRVWVPSFEPLRTAVIQECHDSVTTAHPGREALISVLARKFFWPGLPQDVAQFVRACAICGQVNIWRQKKHGLLQPLELPDRAWAGISMDFLTHLPGPKQFLLVVTDRLTGSLILCPLKSLEVSAVVKAFLKDVYRHHGAPTWIVSDRGSLGLMVFGRDFSNVCALSDVFQIHFTPRRTAQQNKPTRRCRQSFDHMSVLTSRIGVGGHPWHNWH